MNKVSKEQYDNALSELYYNSDFIMSESRSVLSLIMKALDTEVSEEQNKLSKEAAKTYNDCHM